VPNLIKNHGLSIVMFGIFALTLIGLSASGWQNYNNDQQDHGEPTVGFVDYLATPNFGEAVFENWESEFLQMGAYVVLTAILFQRGSSESKDPDKKEPVDEDPRSKRNDPKAPWAVRKGGLALVIYEHSLAIALFLLFFLSFALHVVTGAAEYSQEQLIHGGEAVTAVDYLFTSRLWFESMQNWQSEFMSVGVLIVLSIVLRQRGSPESKPVAASDSATGG
jgi:hypothetical protein